MYQVRQRETEGVSLITSLHVYVPLTLFTENALVY
jgi:hypothetical protein